MSLSPVTKERPDSLEVKRRLDSIENQLQNGAVDTAMTDLFKSLRSWRGEAPGSAWDEIVSEQCLTHSVCDVIYQDPMTFHSYSQPRGYPGDAELLDFIYGLKTNGAFRSVTPVGNAIHQFLFRAAASKAVRARRGVLADLIDRVADTVRNPRVLSVASGHLREAELSRAVQRGVVEDFVAFDQDAASLRLVDQNYSRLGIRSVNGSIREILSGKTRFEDFDCVYAAGLYDYLQQKTARRLTRHLFEALRSGGRLLIANFLPDITDVGFMESFMGWKLIYRSRVEFLDVTEEIPLSEVEDISLYGEPNRHILFLEIQKR